MRIALINKFYPPQIGGIEYHVRLLANKLSQVQDVQYVNVMVANGTNSLSIEKEGSKVGITRLPSWATIQSTPISPAFVKYFSKLDSDLFHFHFPYPFADFAWLMSGDKRPYCITYHSDIIRQKMLNKLYKPIMDRFFDNASFLIATSSNQVDSSPVLQRYKKKVRVIPLGIDPIHPLSKVVVQHTRDIRNKFSEKPIVLFVGRLVYYKGVDVLVKAFRDIDAHLLLVGKGVLENDLKKMAAEMNISDRVHFISNVSDEMMPAYFNSCDIFVLPSIANTEAYGLVQLEAHASGKPVISTNLPTGVPYVNKHGVSGFVVPPGNVNALADAIRELIENPDLSRKLGKQAKARMLEEFTADVMTSKIVDIYRSMLY